VASVGLDIEGRIRHASADAAAMLGYEPAALAGRMLVDLAAPGWRDAAEVAAARVRYGATENFVLMLRGRSGRLNLIEMVVRPTAVRPDQPDGFVLQWASGRPRRQGAGIAVEPQLAIALIRRRDGERLDVAKRLHDDLAPTLAMAKYLVEDAAQRGGRGDRTDACELLGQAAASLRHVVAELRNISNALRPRLLDDLGLLPTLEWFGRGFEEAHPAVSIERVLTASEENVPAGLKVDIFRIVQDALSNVARHSMATVVRLSLLEEDGELRLAIEDNGRGFDPALALRSLHPGVGLQSIGKRIGATGGRFVLESGPQRGTRVTGAWMIEPAGLPAKDGDSSYYQKSVGRVPIRH
jgi:two-component system NarL family sensor kinase